MIWLAFVCSHNIHSNPNRFENVSISLRFLFFAFKSQIFRICVCTSICLAQPWKAKFKIFLFFPRKRNFFFVFMQSLMRTSPTFFDYEKDVVRFQVSEVERRQSVMSPRKSYATFCNQHLQLLKNVAKSKNPNLWLQRKVDSEKEMHLSFLLILLS